MTTATDHNNETIEVSHTIPSNYYASSKMIELAKLQTDMATAIYRFMREDVTDASLQSMVVDSCYKLSATVAYISTPINNCDEGYRLRLTTARTIIANALKAYVFERPTP